MYGYETRQSSIVFEKPGILGKGGVGFFYFI